MTDHQKTIDEIREYCEKKEREQNNFIQDHKKDPILGEYDGGNAFGLRALSREILSIIKRNEGEHDE